MAPSTLMCLWSRNFPMLTPVIRITLDFRTLRSAAGSVLVRNTLWLDLNVDGQWARMGHFWKQWGRHPCLLTDQVLSSVLGVTRYKSVFNIAGTVSSLLSLLSLSLWAVVGSTIYLYSKGPWRFVLFISTQFSSGLCLCTITIWEIHSQIKCLSLRMTIVLLPLEMLQVQPSHAVWCSVLMQDGVTVFGDNY